ncbi:Eukaryotic elongation factor 2 kinase [Hondaea fermentalgiana]|uniref:Eukaryotic elongation factor 2 kinase n=1 Tax=Hondaea fermentalgiana TaxID=2315210 RepID=A0A2R5GBK5_9STRA|nr:Eukaryotic elongation factor 2 kinase [Hondaea fermentalgiana]|eukprot:GBG25124.1 Eukaryotic elongation factor 2 kinase [Hondaea fermentalgiana]
MTASCSVERAEELVYDVKNDVWVTHELLVRINTDAPVAKGRMRECFRMKKIGLAPGSPGSGGKFVSEVKAWADMCSKSICDVVRNLGRRTACRVRTKLGLNAVSFHHPTIITVGELMQCVRAQGARSVALAFADEGHSLQKEDLANLEALIQSGLADDSRWQRTTVNFMAKRYMAAKDDTRKVYEEDVIMQEVCKLLSDQFNAHDPAPPKRIDMLHVGLIRLIDRPGQPFLGYECFLQGRYHKWNTNAGWADTMTVRHTPHAFSFASFRETQGAVMVVDVQGINDLYTDPQVHTRDGVGFGEGNLGARGMALFLRQFRFDLNPVVQYMEYTPFALMEDEQGEASADEVERYRSGKAYLRSQAWSKRRQLSRQSSSSSEGPSIEEIALERGVSVDEDAYGVPEFLLNCAETLDVGECPITLRGNIPQEETAEAAVHAALAKLYDECDERVVCEGVNPEECSRFHKWMAALGGSQQAMITCAEDSRTSASSVTNWYHVAALAGSRPACLAALDRVPSDDYILAIFYTQRALDIDDGKTDAERKVQLEPTSFDLHGRLGAAFRALGEIDTSQMHYQTAADLALEACEFKWHEHYLAALDES